MNPKRAACVRDDAHASGDCRGLSSVHDPVCRGDHLEEGGDNGREECQIVEAVLLVEAGLILRKYAELRHGVKSATYHLKMPALNLEVTGPSVG